MTDGDRRHQTHNILLRKDNDMAACPRKKCGEYNMLRCCLEEGHSKDCVFVVDHANDYSQNKKTRTLLDNKPKPE